MMQPDEGDCPRPPGRLPVANPMHIKWNFSSECDNRIADKLHHDSIAAMS